MVLSFKELNTSLDVMVTHLVYSTSVDSIECKSRIFNPTEVALILHITSLVMKYTGIFTS